jgi:hypothetical protein
MHAETDELDVKVELTFGLFLPAGLRLLDMHKMLRSWRKGAENHVRK